jgi:hypothetical protein
MVVDAGPADVRSPRLQRKALLESNMTKDAEGLGHHLGSYVVSCEYGELQGRH